MLMVLDAQGQDDLVIGVKPSPSGRGAQFVAGNQVFFDTAGQGSSPDRDPPPPYLGLEAAATDDGGQEDTPGGGTDGAKGLDGRSRCEYHKRDAPNGENQTSDPSNQPNEPLERHTFEVIGDLNVVIGHGSSQVNRHRVERNSIRTKLTLLGSEQGVRI